MVVRDGRFLRAVYRLSRVPRGRYRFTGARAVVEDPFGLAQRVQPFADASPLLVYPRLARLNVLFGERGLRAHEAGRICSGAPPDSSCTACASTRAAVAPPPSTGPPPRAGTS